MQHSGVSTDSAEAEAFLSGQKETLTDGVANQRLHLFSLHAMNVLLSCSLIWSLASKSQPRFSEFYCKSFHEMATPIL
jgi:hypothetical protein